ncbi:MAG: SDR family NAD(P)-dependent oxidoreductase [Chloracidobacterium sp.]|nr:SDR family NAD(P)-dependent oxidoreductase [Chloracidobacterium sp.]
MIDLNVQVSCALTHRFLPGMRHRGQGTIINVSSAAVFQPIPLIRTYAATKAFVTSFSEAARYRRGASHSAFECLPTLPRLTTGNKLPRRRRHGWCPLSLRAKKQSSRWSETAMRALGSDPVKDGVSGWTNWLVWRPV